MKTPFFLGGGMNILKLKKAKLICVLDLFLYTM